MRKLMIPLLLCCLLATSAHAADLIDSVHRVETNYTFTVSGALPLSDGGIILAGQVAYPSEYRTADMAEVDRLTKNVTTDGYAICLNEDGTMRWDFYGGMAGRWNNCQVLGVLPDGRAVLSVRHITEYNHRTQDFSFYFVDQDGHAEKDAQMTKSIAAAFDPETLRLVKAGYIGGANSMLMAWNGEFPTDATLLDFDFREVWRHNPSDLGEIYWLDIYEAADGYLLHGNWNNDTSTESAAIIRKLDPNGKVVWTFNEKQVGPSGGAYQLAMLPDGSMTFRSTYSAEGMRLDDYNYPIHALTRLDQDGTVLWSRFFDEEGYSWIGASLPFGDGIVLGATTTFPNHELLLLDMDGNILSKAAYGEAADGELGNIPNLVAGPDGSVYAYGTLHEKVPESSLTGGDTICSFYIKIDESMFE